MIGLVVVVGVLAVGTAVGLVWKRRDGRLAGPRAAPDAPVRLPGVLPEVDFAGADLTFVQFSSAFCAPCRVTRQTLARVAETSAGVAHVEIDAESRLAAVRALGIRSTPTTIVADSHGREVGRAVGAPRLEEVRALVAAVRNP